MTRVTGIALVAGAAVLLVFNLLFPRADDPWDIPAVLEMMAENAALRQASFLAVTAGLLAVTAGIAGIQRAVGTFCARIGLYGALVGATLFAAAAGLGMAATGAAVQWVDTGSDVASAEYAIAAALNLADDHVWFWSIIVYWTALGLLGAAMASESPFPRSMGLALMVIGFATAGLVGVPLAFGVEAPGLFLAFGAGGMLTTLWALAAGIWTLRSQAEVTA
jgi:hypothetical protein